MVAGFAKRMLTEPDPRALRKFVWNFGIGGLRSVQKFKSRLKRGEHFPRPPEGLFRGGLFQRALEFSSREPALPPGAAPAGSATLAAASRGGTR